MRSNADFQVGGLFPVLLPQGLGGATAPEMRWVAVLLCGHCELPSLCRTRTLENSWGQGGGVCSVG